MNSLAAEFAGQARVHAEQLRQAAAEAGMEISAPEAQPNLLSLQASLMSLLLKGLATLA